MFRKEEVFIVLVVVLLCSPLVVDKLSAQRICFQARRDFGVGTLPNSVAVGDFNGDNYQDLAVANSNSRDVSILLGNGDGTFAPAQSFAVGGSASFIAVGDFNNDGRQDLAVTNGASNNVSILLGNGDGTFQPARQIDLGPNSNPHGITVGDWNNDRKLDLAIAGYNCDLGGRSWIYILIGDGLGGFQVGSTYIGLCVWPHAIVSGDFNRDNNADLAIALDSTPGGVAIFLGNGTGFFHSNPDYMYTFATSSGMRAIATGDFNADGILDLAVASKPSSVNILLGVGNGSFQPLSQTFAVGAGPESIVVGDFNNDYRPDLATANFQANNVSVLLGNGNGTFQPALNFAVGTAPMSVAVGDFNRDGVQDLAVVNQGSYPPPTGNTVSILLGYNPNVTVRWQKDYIYVNGQLTATVEKP